MKLIVGLIIMTIIGSFAGLFLKKISKKIIFFDLNFYVGGFLYFLSALINIYLLKSYDYTLILPMTSLTYVWSLIIAKLFLNENINARKIIGMVLIVLGVVLLII